MRMLIALHAGFLMKRVEAGPDGKLPATADAQWAKWFVQLSGTIMSTWNAADMEEAARNGRTVRRGQSSRLGAAVLVY